MNPEIKTQWLADLRSGEFKQGEGALSRHEDGNATFCCLGLLCEQAVKAEVISKHDDYFGKSTYGAGLETNVLPQEVVEWAGLDLTLDPVWHDDRPKGANPRVVDSDGEEYVLAQLNDEGSSFSRIADLIENQL